MLTPHLADFLAAKEAYGLSPKTLVSYERHGRIFLAWLDEQALDLSRPTLTRYVAHLQARPISIASKVAAVRDVLVFVRWLFEEGRQTPFSTKKLKPRLPRRRPASYSIEQLKALLAGASARDRALMILLLDTGLRVGELVQLERDSIDPINGHFSVIGKGDKERDCWASPTARAAIDAYVARRTDKDPALWVGQHGRPLGTSGVHQLIERRAIAAGLRADVRRLVHAFRATFAKHYVQRGGDLESLSSLLGHTSIVMAGHYAQLSSSELAAQKARVDPLGAVL